MIIRFATALLLIGGINWGLIGIFNFDFIAAVFCSPMSVVSRLVYTLIGISAVIDLFYLPYLLRVHATRTQAATQASASTVDRTDRAA